MLSDFPRFQSVRGRTWIDGPSSRRVATASQVFRPRNSFSRGSAIRQTKLLAPTLAPTAGKGRVRTLGGAFTWVITSGSGCAELWDIVLISSMLLRKLSSSIPFPFWTISCTILEACQTRRKDARCPPTCTSTKQAISLDMHHFDKITANRSSILSVDVAS